MKRLFLHRPGTARPTDHMERAAERHALTDLTILKTRPDRVIARGVHAEWGRVALKATDPFINAIPAHSGRLTDDRVAARPASFLPTVHAVGLGYSVSEWVDGRHVHDLDPEIREALPVIDFIEALRAWCCDGSEQKPLEPSAVRSIIRFYVETTVRRMGYRSAANCLRASARFRRDQRRLGGYVDEMIALATDLGLQETLMFSDVQIWNVLFSPRDNRLVLVDFEALRPGSYLFDAVFWLSSLMIHGLPRPLIEPVARHVFSPDLMPTSDCVRFFRSFAAYVVETYMTIDGHGRGAIQAKLEVLPAAAG
jgi:hypothetical protein